jgi:hypothetical protein
VKGGVGRGGGAILTLETVNKTMPSGRLDSGGAMHVVSLGEKATARTGFDECRHRNDAELFKYSTGNGTFVLLSNEVPMVALDDNGLPPCVFTTPEGECREIKLQDAHFYLHLGHATNIVLSCVESQREKVKYLSFDFLDHSCVGQGLVMGSKRKLVVAVDFVRSIGQIWVALEEEPLVLIRCYFCGSEQYAREMLPHFRELYPRMQIFFYCAADGTKAALSTGLVDLKPRFPKGAVEPHKGFFNQPISTVAVRHELRASAVLGEKATVGEVGEAIMAYEAATSAARKESLPTLLNASEAEALSREVGRAVAFGDEKVAKVPYVCFCPGRGDERLKVFEHELDDESRGWVMLGAEGGVVAPEVNLSERASALYLEIEAMRAHFTPNLDKHWAYYLGQCSEAMEMPSYLDLLKELDAKWNFWEIDSQCEWTIRGIVSMLLGRHASNSLAVQQIREWLATRPPLTG